MRRPIIAGNWKMHNTVAESVELASQLRRMLGEVKEVEVVVAPPFTSLPAVAGVLKDTNIFLSSQDVFWEEKGAFTGEISPLMLKDLGCTYALVGHSERRQYFGETDEMVNKKLKALLKASLTPIVCVGETLEERESGKTLEILEVQVQGAFAGFTPEEVKRVVIAYEPVWAIGTGRTATPAQAQEAHHFLRGLIAQRIGKKVAEGIRILYGGSVRPDNIDQLMAEEDIDGALVGGASLQAESFARIVKFKA